MPSTRVAFQMSSSTPRRPASMIAMTRPEACQMAGDDERVDHHVLVDEPVEGEAREAEVAHELLDAEVGFSNHCQTRPVTMKDIA